MSAVILAFLRPPPVQLWHPPNPGHFALQDKLDEMAPLIHNLPDRALPLLCVRTDLSV